MNKEVKDKWVAALRSGEYKQTTRALRDQNGFCCLGVLCDLHAKEVVNLWGDYFHYENSKLDLPEPVRTWANLTYKDPWITFEDESTNALSYLNDTVGLSFDEIATLIEEQL